MAANFIIEQLTTFINFSNEGFKYNLQVFPDTLTGAVFLFALLFQSPPFATLSASILILNLVRPSLANILSGIAGDNLQGQSDGSRCSGHFPGVSFERLIFTGSEQQFGRLEDKAPSYYSTFLGFLGAYVGLLPIVYSQEIANSSSKKASSAVAIVVLAFVLLLGGMHRIFNCESVQNLIVGMVAGGIVGMLCVAFFAFISDRRLTNILGFPLIRDKSTDGKPIYVCERPV